MNAIADAGKKASARLAAAYGRACYAWAVEKDLLAANPFRDVKTDTIPARDRVLTDSELRLIWQATAEQGRP